MVKRFISLIAFVFLFMGCNEDSYFSQFYETQGYWHKDSIADFRFEVQDTVNKYDCYINIRNTEEYKFSNLFIITTMQFPYGKIVVDTLEYKMAFKDGRLMGEGFGSLRYNKLWYKEAVQFSEPGEYQIEIRHAMRKAGQIQTLPKLDGVEEIGFSCEPLTQEKS